MPSGTEQRDNGHDIRRRKDQEKCLEQNQSLYNLFVHLTKAFDTVAGGLDMCF